MGVDVSAVWAFAAGGFLLMVLFPDVWHSLYRRFTDRPSWALSNPLAMVLFQAMSGLLAGLTAFLVWINDEDANSFFCLWFFVLGVYAFSLWLAIGQAWYACKWLVLVAALGWVGVLVWAVIYAWYSVFSSVAVFFSMLYYVVLAMEIAGRWNPGDVPAPKDTYPNATIVISSSANSTEARNQRAKAVTPASTQTQRPAAANVPLQQIQAYFTGFSNPLRDIPKPDANAGFKQKNKDLNVEDIQL